MVHCLCHSDLLNILWQDVGFLSDKWRGFPPHTRILVTCDAFIPSPIVQQQTFRVVFLPILVQFDKEELLLGEAGLAVPSLEGGCEEVLSHDGGVGVERGHILDLLLVEDGTGHTVD